MATKKYPYDQAGRFVPTTLDTTADKNERVEKALRKKKNHTRSNRDIAKELQVDESMVRKWKNKLGIPQLRQHGGRSK